MICKLKDEKGKRVIDIDGRTLFPIAYMSYAPIKENYEKMRARGIKLFMFPIYAGDEGINMESGLRPFTDNFFKGYGTPVFLGFLYSSAGKESACNSGGLGLIPELGRSPGEGKGYPLQYSGLENFMDSPWSCKELDMTE